MEQGVPRSIDDNDLFLYMPNRRRDGEVINFSNLIARDMALFNICLIGQRE